MTGETTAVEVVACVFLAVGIYSASLVPFFLLVEVEHLTPRCVRELPAVVRPLLRDAAVSATALLLILSGPTGDTR